MSKHTQALGAIGELIAQFTAKRDNIREILPSSDDKKRLEAMVTAYQEDIDALEASANVLAADELPDVPNSQIEAFHGEYGQVTLTLEYGVWTLRRKGDRERKWSKTDIPRYFTNIRPVAKKEA